MKGLVIALEGQDGTGKSTVIDAITGYFDEMGLDYINAREPGSTDIGEKIRDILADKANKDMKIAVFDLGGGTFDISILEFGGRHRGAHSLSSRLVSRTRRRRGAY